MADPDDGLPSYRRDVSDRWRTGGTTVRTATSHGRREPGGGTFSR
jgi:hypothetical protein